MTHDDVMSVYLYNPAVSSDPDAGVIYDNVVVSSVFNGLVLTEDFQTDIAAKGWSVSAGTEQTNVNLSQVGTQAQLAAFLPTLLDPARDRVTRYVYDAAGRQTYSMDATGSVTQYEYDAAGQMVAKRELANQMPSGTAIRFKNPDGRWTKVSKYLGTFKAGDIVTASVRFKTAGGLEGRMFLGDDFGADAYDNAEGTVVAGSDGWQTLTLTHKMTHDDVMSVYIYDLVAAPNPDAGVVYDNMYISSALKGEVLTENFQNFDAVAWNAAGILDQVQVNLSQVGTQAQLAAFLPTLLDPARDRTTRYAYDPTGRLLYTQDALGGVTRLRYDAFGRVIEQLGYANRLATPLPAVAPTSDPVALVPAADRRTRTVYDALGRPRFTVALADGPLNRAVVTETLYDAFGRVSRTVQYADFITYSAVTDATPDSAVRALLPAFTGTAPLSARETIYTYDAAGRLLHTAQSQSSTATGKTFSLGERRYDAFGRLTEQVAYATTAVLSDLPGVASASQLAARIVADPANDRRTRYGYDAAGRVLTTTDAEGYAERTTYDAFGRKTQVTDKTGATTDYQYDAVGHLTQTLSAAVDVYGVGATLTVGAAGTSLSQRIATRNTYDAFGQLLTRTEAAGLLGQERTTRYTYDARGRQTGTTFAKVGVYQASDTDLTRGAGGAALKREDAETALELSTQTVYDAFGQAVASRDVSGNFSHKTYDLLGRVVLEIDANRQVSQHLYSALAGQSSSLVRYAGAASFTDTLTTSADTLAAAAAALSLTDRRTLTTTFDTLGRTLRTDDLGDGAWSATTSAGTLTSGTWTRTTAYAYDALGNLSASKTFLDPTAAASPTTTPRWSGKRYAYYLDGTTRQELDAEGGLTQHTRNAFGEDSEVTDYATPLADINADPATWAVAAQKASVANTVGFDRITQTTYDRRGQVATLTQANLVLGSRTANATGPGTLGTVTGSLRTTNDYDGAGNLTRATQRLLDANGTPVTSTSSSPQQTQLQTTYVYDALGRLTATRDAANFGSSTRYDALGNAVQTTRHAQANALVTVAAANGQRYARYLLASDPTADSADQVTTTRYDALGHAVQVRDALNSALTQADRYLSYDAAGHVAKQWQAYQDRDGWRNTVSVFSYDKLGQQTATTTLKQGQRSDALSYVVESAAYNAFGEILTKTLQERNTTGLVGSAVVTQQNSYDSGGRLSKSTAGGTTGSITRVYAYDLLDHVTVALSSTADTGGIDLSAAASTAQSLATYSLAQGVSRTTTTYDRLGRATSQASSGATHAGAVLTASTSQVLDRWGNTLSVTKNGTERLRYRFDAGNRVVQQTQVNADVWDLGTTATTQDATQRLFYDAWGHNIGSVDALGNTNAAQYNDRGQRQYEYHADTGTVANSYDAFGRLTGKIDELGRQTAYTYDRGDHETSRSVRTAAEVLAGTVLAGHSLGASTYDELGRKKSDTTGEDAASWNQTRTYDYDARGLMWRSTDARGNAVLTEYDLGGRKAKETDANSLVATWAYDTATGLLTGHTDIGGATFTYSYNQLGQLKTQTNTRGQSLTYAYFEDGSLKSLTDGYRGSSTTYDTDADGNRTRETFTQSGTVYRDVTSRYDKQGRLTHTEDTAPGVLPAGSGNLYAIDIGFDAAGNRRRVSTASLSLASNGTTTNTPSLLWYTYDAMNRWRGQGTLVSGAIQESKASTFDAAGRVKSAFDTGVSNRYELDFAGRIVTEYTTGTGANNTYAERKERSLTYTAGVQKETRLLYASDRKTDTRLAYTTTNFLANGLTQQVKTQEEGQARRYTVQKRVKVEGLWEMQDVDVATTAVVAQDTGLQTYEYDRAGNLAKLTVKGYTAVNADAGLSSEQTKRTRWASQSVYASSYYLLDGYKERGQALSGSQWAEGKGQGNGDTAYTPSESRMGYDANGQLAQITRALSNGTQQNTWLITDTAGHLVQKREDTNAVTWGQTNTGYPQGSGYPYPSVIAQYNQDAFLKRWLPADNANPTPQDPVKPTPNATSTAWATLAGTPTQRDANTWNRQSNLFVNDQGVGSYTHTSYPGNVYASAWIDVSARASASSLDGSALFYSVQDGDTLQSIAQRQWGDTALWYLLADANGLTRGPQDALSVGSTVKVPRLVRATNTATSFSVIDPAKTIGNTSPDMVMPPPPPRQGCGVLGQLIMVVVAVAVAYVTAGALAPSMGPILAGAVGGAAGSVASQGVGMLTGDVQSFSWKGVALGALGGAVSGAVMGIPQAGVEGLFGGGAGGLAKGVFDVSNTFGAAAINAAATSALTQGLAVVTGLQDKFSWRSVAASAIAAPVAQFVGAQVFEQAAQGAALGVGDRLARSMVNGVVSQGVRMLVTRKGKVDYASIAGDAFGNALGESLAAKSNPASAYDYRNGSDVESDDAMSRTPAQSIAKDFYGQLVGMMSNSTGTGSPRDTSNDILVAAGPGFTGLGMDRLTLGDRTGDTQLEKLSRVAEAKDRIAYMTDTIAMLKAALNGGGAPGGGSDAAWVASQNQATSNLYASGAGDVREYLELSASASGGSVSRIAAEQLAPLSSLSLGLDALDASLPSLPEFNGRGTAGYSAVSTWDAFRRVDYKAQAVSNSRAFMAEFNNLSRVQVAQGQALAQQAFEARQALRTATQGTLSPGGRLVSMAIEQKYTFASQFDKYAGRAAKAGPYAEMDVYKRIIEASGSSNKWVSRMNTFTKYAGPIGTAVGLGASGYAIANAPEGQTGRVAAEEAGGLLGGLAGGMAGTYAAGALTLGAAAVGLTVAAPVVLLAGAAAGIAGAVYVSGYGREAGGYYYKAWWKQ